MTDTVKFDKWFGELKVISEFQYKHPRVTDDDMNDWLDYFEDGYSPKEAWDDNNRHGDIDE